MNSRPRDNAVNRREFLSKTGTGLIGAATIPATAAWGTLPESPAALNVATASRPSVSAAAKKKILIGVFDPVYNHLSLDDMLDKVSALGLEAMEIGTGSYPNNPHCALDELIQDKAKARAWQKKFEDKGIRVAALSCHGNPVHPNAQHAQKDVDTFRKTVLLAEMLEIKVIVGFEGKRFEPPLVERSSSGSGMRQIPTLRVRHGQPVHVIRKMVNLARPKHQMPVIRHDAVRQ